MVDSSQLKNKTQAELIELLMKVDFENDFLKNQADILKNQADILKNEADVLKNEADVLKNEADVLKNEADVLKNETDVLKNETDVLKDRIQKTELEKKTLENKIQTLLEELQLLRHQKFSKKSEKNPKTVFDEAQPPDNLEEIEKADAEIGQPEPSNSLKQKNPPKDKKPGGRQKLPPEVPRQDQIHDIPLEETICHCGYGKKCIGEDITEQLDLIPAQYVVIRHIRKKYACQKCERPGIIIASMPPQPIPRSIAGPGLLAYILISKYADHIPLYRMEQVLQRYGVDIPRATTSAWVIKVSELFKPLINLMQENITNYDISYVDETTVQVLKELKRRADQKSYMWCFLGGLPGKPVVIYRYSETREHTIPLNFLGFDYFGYVHCDGYSAYETMASSNRAVLVGCMLHARRKFMDVTKTTKKPGLANQAIQFFKKLSNIEHKIKTACITPDDVKKYRKEHSEPILDQFKAWLDQYRPLVQPNTLIDKAIKYTLNQWPKLIKYLEDGRLEWSNNRTERAIKPFVIGRKNWLFANSVAGAEAGAIIFSIIETAKENNIDPFRYLNYLLVKLPACKSVEEFEKLLPWNLDQNWSYAFD